MENLEKPKVTLPLPGMRQGWFTLFIMVGGSLLGVYFSIFPPYDILLVPPFFTFTLYLALFVPFLWIPFYVVWRKNLAETGWVRTLWLIATFTFCSGCALSYRYIHGSVTNFDCQPTTEKIVVCTRHLDSNQGGIYFTPSQTEIFFAYQRIPNTPFMELIKP